MRVMMIRINQNPQIISIEHDLKTFQALVGGMIEVVEPFQDDVVIVCDENGRSTGKPINRTINEKMDICGDFFLCGQDDDALADFPLEKVFKYNAMFHLPN